MKLKDIIKYIFGVCIVNVADATNEEFEYVDDFMSDNEEKMKLYEDADVLDIMPHDTDYVQINVSIN